jgi:hypothetical protein
MKTQIDNGQRVFQVVTSIGKQAFCNLPDLNRVVEELNTHEGYFKIYHFWDNKPKKVSKKYLRDMFEAHDLKQEFYY